MVDVVVQPQAPIAPTSDTPSTVRLARGGSAGNVAVALAGQSPDLEVTFVGCVGDDGASEMVSAAFLAAGVRPRLLTRPGRTGVVVSLVSPDGERAMLTDRGVNSQLDWTAVNDELVGVSHLHVSGYLLLDPHTRAGVAPLLALARSKDVSTSLDVCSVEPLRQAGASVFDDALVHVNFLFANEEEALTLSGHDGLETALGALARRVETVVVTRGANGALAVQGERLVTVPASASRIVDTTGAGDSATGAFLGAILAGAGLEISLERAMAEAARVVTHLGAG